jgi:hypothetical protein
LCITNCLPFGLSIAHWVFSKVTRHLVTFWRKDGIMLLPYMDDFMFMKVSF